MTVSSAALKLKYLFYLGASTTAAFLTFSILVSIQSTTVMQMPTALLNTVILLFLWAFSFTSNHSFIQDNFLIMVAIPFIVLTGGNLMLALVTPGSSMTEFGPFILSTGFLMILSHRTSLIESKLKED